MSVKVANGKVAVLMRDDSKIVLSLLNVESEIVNEVVGFKGLRGFILRAWRDRYLVSVDYRVYLIEDSESKLVLKASKPSNIFWHAVEAKGRVFLREYGTSPTGIYVSEDLIDWRKIVSNIDIDDSSRHFHYIAYDPYRGQLIVTLGDGCLTRVIISEDLGETWKSLYRGPW